MQDAAKVAALAQAQTSKKNYAYKFGVRVPRSMKDALDLDKEDDTDQNLWTKAMDKEVKKLLGMGTFRILKASKTSRDIGIKAGNHLGTPWIRLEC